MRCASLDPWSLPVQPFAGYEVWQLYFFTVMSKAEPGTLVFRSQLGWAGLAVKKIYIKLGGD